MNHMLRSFENTVSSRLKWNCRSMAPRKVLFVHFSDKIQELLDCNKQKEVPRPLSGWYYNNNNNLFRYSHMGSKVKRAKCAVPRKVRNRAFFVWFVCDISSPCTEFVVISRRDVWKVFSLGGWSCRLALTWPWIRSLQLPIGDATAIFYCIFLLISPSSSTKKVSPSFESVLCSLQSILTCRLM